MSKVIAFLLLSTYFQSAQLSGSIPSNDPTLAQAVEVVHKTGLRDIMTYPKQSFKVTWNGMRLGTFLSLGARTEGSSYQCLHTFIPTDASSAPSSIVTAGAGKLGAEICDHPRAVGILPSSPDQIRIGILYENSDYLDSNKNSGMESPSVSAAVVIDPRTRRMALDTKATEVLQKAGPASLSAMRALFK